MDSENLAKLLRLKQEMQSQSAPQPGRLTPDDFKSLAKEMGVGLKTSKPKPKSKWKKKPCMMCSAPLVIHKDWENPPRYCKSCKEARRAFWRSRATPGGKTEYSCQSLVPGGSPGSGKRR